MCCAGRYTTIVSKGGESSNTGGIGTYSYDERSLTLGTEGEYKACEQYDVIVHEMTHGYLYNTVKLTNTDNVDISAIHEGYGDILACLANDNWHFQENYRGGGNASRDLANPGPNFQVKYDSKNTGAGCHYRATILGHAAYKMNHPDSKNKGAAIDKDLLAKIWFDSMGKLPGKNTGFSDVAASVINSAYERGCSSAQIDTIRTAFRDANIPVPNRTVFGRVYDGLNNPISKFNLLIDRNYTVKTVDNIYCACTYDDTVGEDLKITCKSDGYTDFNYLVSTDDKPFSVTECNVVFEKGTAQAVGSISGQVYSWYGRFENTDGITVVLNSGAKTYTTTVDNYYFSFSNIPVGSYTITDNRNLTYEGKRCAEMSMDFEMNADDDLGAEFTLPPKYSLQRGYLTSTIYGIKYPIIYE